MKNKLIMSKFVNFEWFNFNSSIQDSENSKIFSKSKNTSINITKRITYYSLDKKFYNKNLSSQNSFKNLYETKKYEIAKIKIPITKNILPNYNVYTNKKFFLENQNYLNKKDKNLNSVKNFQNSDSLNSLDYSIRKTFSQNENFQNLNTNNNFYKNYEFKNLERRKQFENSNKNLDIQKRRVTKIIKINKNDFKPNRFYDYFDSRNFKNNSLNNQIINRDLKFIKEKKELIFQNKNLEEKKNLENFPEIKRIEKFKKRIENMKIIKKNWKDLKRLNKKNKRKKEKFYKKYSFVKDKFVNKNKFFRYSSKISLIKEEDLRNKTKNSVIKKKENIRNPLIIKNNNLSKKTFFEKNNKKFENNNFEEKKKKKFEEKISEINKSITSINLISFENSCEKKKNFQNSFEKNNNFKNSIEKNKDFKNSNEKNKILENTPKKNLLKNYHKNYSMKKWILDSEIRKIDSIKNTFLIPFFKKNNKNDFINNSSSISSSISSSVLSSISSSNQRNQFSEYSKSSEKNNKKINLKKKNDFEKNQKTIVEKNENFISENYLKKNSNYLSRGTFKEQLGNFVEKNRKTPKNKKIILKNKFFFEDFNNKKISFKKIKSSELIEITDFK